MIVGFTGTRDGMTPSQRARVLEILRGATEAHHGDCIGADAEFHELAVYLGVPVVIHPPEGRRYRAYCNAAEAIRIERPKPYLARNQDIVIASDLLVASPKERTEPAPARGQGTWSTVRFARRYARPCEVVWP
jgi:hypothetical protein